MKLLCDFLDELYNENTSLPEGHYVAKVKDRSGRESEISQADFELCCEFYRAVKGEDTPNFQKGERWAGRYDTVCLTGDEARQRLPFELSDAAPRTRALELLKQIGIVNRFNIGGRPPHQYALSDDYWVCTIEIEEIT